MKWISIKDELPRDNKPVIIAKIWQGRCNKAYGYDIAVYTNRWRYLQGGWDLEYDPDYWAPIAPLPKDGE
ncbi:hypothetical protein [uncultured Megasphaera sp.]|jgi:hypothetical protein|uniref:hypothetical protein n=1 Tax=uncultured Megasphaera sp. TaxID=165188 RepID=UPI00267020F2|nr:hypothetical protein [uncultured Megasphaera sp.]